MGDRTARAIRGATTVDSNSPEEIRHATRELLETIIARNSITSADVISAIFTVTHDLTSDFPAHAARELGWLDVPLLCTLEIPVPGSLPRCIRVLLHVESTASRADLRHVYLHAARALRPDLAG
ncbi:MAG: chorismate mutase [Gemmatimonadota bacterium]|nr:chorismate mutase [Gemmatimonadota bacterium]